MRGTVEKALPEILKALADRRTRLAAATALVGLRPNDSAVIDRIIECLRDKEDVRARARLILVLEKVGPAAAKAVPALVEALGDPYIDPDSRDTPPAKPIQLYAIAALGSIGKRAESAVPRLLEIVRDKSEPVHARTAAAEALKKINVAAGHKAGPISGFPD
jgi:HEAT repeat protein